jgi:hypothetical protein
VAETILAKLAVEVTAKATQFGKVLNQQEKALKSFQGTVSGVSNFLKGALATIGAAALGREIIDVTSQFQKFSAVLTNTLGSNSAAQIALRDIEEFAKRTPFAVDELTSSYVKLANQGFKPTTEELRKLGDLASSTGKGFDQLTEAIIDAQTGEFERLKEFGIRASKQGDQVKFTFKGVETQTKFTSQAIRDYILSLGDAEGVSGAMAAISQTLGGQISNLGDSWTQLLKTIGDGNKGPLSGAIKGLTDLIDRAKEFVKTNDQIKEELQVEGQAAIIEDLKELVSITDDVDASAATLISRLEEQKEAIVDQAAPLFANFKAHEEEIKILEQKASVIDAQIVAINDYTKAETKRVEAAEEANKKENASIGIIGDIEKQLKALETQKKASFSTAEIASFNGKIEELRDKLEVLNASRQLSNFGQKTLDPNFKFEEPKQLDVDPNGDLLKPIPLQIDIDTAMNNLEFATVAIKEFGVGAINSFDQMRLAGQLQDEQLQRQTQAAFQFGDAFGEAISGAIEGQKSFSQVLKTLTKQILGLFLQQALGAAIAGSFKTAKNPIIGAVLAGVATGVVSAMFSKIGGPTKSVSGSVSEPTERGSSSAFRQDLAKDQVVLVGGEIRIKNNQLVVALENARKEKQRTG